MRRWQKICIICFVVASLTLFGGVFFLRDNTSTLQISDQRITLEIAQTPDQQRKGLCCRDSLPENSGMLFVYERPGDYRFWMKDTRIPLDMYWISSEKKVVHIEENVQPESYPKTFGTDTPSQYVLETNAGFADQHHITVGDSVEFEN